jgi:hypothetical protein
VGIRAGPSARAGACHADAVAASAQRVEGEGDARLRSGRLRARAERIEDKASVGLIPGCSIGDKLEVGGSPDREGALCAKEGN